MRLLGSAFALTGAFALRVTFPDHLRRNDSTEKLDLTPLGRPATPV